MGDPGIHFGVSGNALVRAAEAMLRALGGAEVTFLFPLLQLPEDSSAELGMVDPGVEEVRLSRGGAEFGSRSGWPAATTGVSSPSSSGYRRTELAKRGIGRSTIR